MVIPTDFAARLIQWQQQYGRHDLPWQGGNAYQVWLSEVMLQQTQVKTVIPYYLKFINEFPDVASLAAAGEARVLSLWSGLGYYARGRNLYKAACVIEQQYGGVFPRQFEQILALPGVGRSTAAAVCAQAFHQRYAILDGNVKRLLTRYFAVHGDVNQAAVQKKLWQYAEQLLPQSDVASYTQALMDMGATVCVRRRPGCDQCPLHRDCQARQLGLTDQLPTPRVRKKQPQRQSVFLLLCAGEQLLLQQRAPTGIWGGLWSLPQIDEVGPEQALQAVQQYLRSSRLSADYLYQLDSFVHVFTHFRLEITPVRVQLAPGSPSCQEPGQQWVSREQALQLGLPAPVRALLQQSPTDS